MNNLVTRSLSGFLFVAIVVASILVSPYSFVVVFTVLSAWSVYEFHQLGNHQKEVDINPVMPVIATVILSVTSFLYASEILTYPSFSFYGLFLIVVFIAELYKKKENPFHNLAYVVMGQIYVALPFALLNFILYVGGYQPWVLLAVFATIWLNDTAAYLFGITFGKHRLFERVSPKKSWEGFFGGAMAALLSGFIFSKFIPEISLIQWFIFAEIVVIFGTFGDLLESLMKRTIHVKDSGNAIPGHGGLLDRFDSMLLVAPAIYIYLSFLFR